MSVEIPSGSIDDEIYVGLWSNRSLGAFLGATLTLDQRNGSLLIAFFAVFVSAVGRGLWLIVRFILHTSFSTTVAQDGVYHQRQAVLRNTPLAHDAALELLRVSFVWKKRAESVQQRMLPVALLAATISATSLVASVISSKALVHSTNEALISGRLCGKLDNYTTLDESADSFAAYLSLKGMESFEHATRCDHGAKDRPTESCGAFVRSSLPFTSDKNATCPFSKELCRSSTRNLLLQSDDIDSLTHLGLNTEPRFVLRHHTHCAPLNTGGFTKISQSKGSGKRYLQYTYGSASYQPFTYQIDLDKEDPTPGASVGDYKITVARDSDFNFIPQLQSPNGTVSLIFLDASEVLSFNQTNDPWFTGMPLMNRNISAERSSTKGAGVIGCVTKRFYCNPLLHAKTACVDGYDHGMLEMLSHAWPDAQDLSVIRPILLTINTNYLDTWYSLRSVPALFSRNTIMGNMQMATLPDDRWQAEREYLYRASLVNIQSLMTEYARGFWTDPLNNCSTGMECRKICKSQKIRSSNHFSFSAWTLAATLLLGVLIMIASTFVERINATACYFVAKGTNRNQKYSRIEWRSNSTLQIQRIAHETLGLGRWTKTDGAVPVTDLGDALGVLDVSNTKHARLMKPSEELVIMPVSRNDLNAMIRPRYARVSSIE